MCHDQQNDQILFTINYSDARVAMTTALADLDRVYCLIISLKPC